MASAQWRTDKHDLSERQKSEPSHTKGVWEKLNYSLEPSMSSEWDGKGGSIDLSAILHKRVRSCASSMEDSARKIESRPRRFLEPILLKKQESIAFNAGDEQLLFSSGTKPMWTIL